MKINFFQGRIFQLVIFGFLLIFIIGVTYIYYKNKPTIAVPPVEDALPIVALPKISQVRTTVLGQSVENRNIEAVTFGNGATNVLLVGGVHGGYEWNSVMLAEKMIEFFSSQPKEIPSALTVTIIPVLNPDGLAVVTGGQIKNLTSQLVTNWNADGRGRFNSNKVDLNRNFACKWQPNSIWKGQITSAGQQVFSEPETKLLRDYVLNTKPTAVVFWHSVAGAVYGSECEKGILPITLTIMETYAKASQYEAIPIFDAYPITGDAEGWLASIGIPAITVELESRNSIEWEKNLAGTKALLLQISQLAK